MLRNTKLLVNILSCCEQNVFDLIWTNPAFMRSYKTTKVGQYIRVVGCTGLINEHVKRIDNQPFIIQFLINLYCNKKLKHNVKSFSLDGRPNLFHMLWIMCHIKCSVTVYVQHYSNLIKNGSNFMNHQTPIKKCFFCSVKVLPEWTASDYRNDLLY